MMPPRRPTSPYVIFSMEYLADQSNLKASMSAGDTSAEDRKALFSARGKAAGAAWRELPEFEKEKYSAEYAKRQEQYRADLAAWQESVDPETVAIINKHRRARKLSRIRVPTKGPKHPMSSYLLFLSDNLAEIRNALPAGTPPTEVTKEAARRWHQLPDAEKQPYVAKAVEGREAYHKAVSEYKAGTV
ncbi:hypothetical protein PENSPDRAFT_258034 [Peniophora sp. CONT]|nr:hypothetical protein PENSPDRAFT_258034 [Peniophora sp. CONT]